MSENKNQDRRQRAGLEWTQSQLSFVLDDVEYNHQHRAVTAAGAYLISLKKKPGNLHFSHYIVTFDAIAIGRARGLDVAKKLAQEHADKTAEAAG